MQSAPTRERETGFPIASGTSGTTTCRPLPPWSSGSSPGEGRERGPHQTRAAITCDQVTSGPGSRSMMMRSGRSSSPASRSRCGFEDAHLHQRDHPGSPSTTTYSGRSRSRMGMRRSQRRTRWRRASRRSSYRARSAAYQAERPPREVRHDPLAPPRSSATEPAWSDRYRDRARARDG